MSDGYGSGASGAPSGKVDTTKQEATAVKDTATDAAKDVAHATKDEVASVAHETKVQVQDLYAQSRQELGDQAAKQQERVASGLRSVGDELGSMARNSEGTGVASDLVQRAANHVGGAASWLSDRDPAGVLHEVKAFARRRPGMFIVGAAIAGILVGRLTRALASSAADKSGSDSPVSDADAAGKGAAAPRDPAIPATSAPAAAGMRGSMATGEGIEDAPVYAESVAKWSQERGEGSDERPHTL